MKKKVKPQKPADEKALELPGTMETYNSELDRAIHDVWLNRIALAEIKDKEKEVEDRLMIEMEKAGLKVVVKLIDGCRFVVELVTKEKKLKFKGVLK